MVFLFGRIESALPFEIQNRRWWGNEGNKRAVGRRRRTNKRNKKKCFFFFSLFFCWRRHPPPPREMEGSNLLGVRRVFGIRRRRFCVSSVLIWERPLIPLCIRKKKGGKKKEQKKKRVDATDGGSFLLMADWIGAALYGERERELHQIAKGMKNRQKRFPNYLKRKDPISRIDVC